MSLPFFKKKKTTEGGQAPNKGVGSAEILARGLTDVKDIIAPSAIEVDFDHLKIGDRYFRTLFVSGYPRFVGANWLSPLINFDHTLEISMFYYPVASKGVLDDLRRKIGEMEATVSTDAERGRVIDPAVRAALDDAKVLQEQLVKGIEKFFQFSFYITIPAKSLEELNQITKQVEATLGSLMLISKHATLQMEQGFQSTIPLGLDKLVITRNMDTTALATTFPFTSSELSTNRGILYGINEHNGSLVVFDRFSMENANTVIFAKAGAGKSYLVKLEALWSLMFGTEILVIDPEAEYERVCDALNGEYIRFSPTNPTKLNPFELPQIKSDENELGLKILSLHTLIKIMCGQLSPGEEAILDRALIATYRLKGITTDPATQTKEPPILSDLHQVLLKMDSSEAKSLSQRLERYTQGSLAGIFDQHSTMDLTNPFTVFSTRDLEDVLRPIAIYIILDFIWTRIKRELKKRVLVVDEAWYLMQHPDSAAFMYSIAKRARKYYLGLTTITQDVQDFLGSDYGKAIVTNSSLQILLKQHPAAIDLVGQTFYLSEGEKRLLLACDVGEGIFFAGANHVAIRIVASPEEHQLITTKPSELLEMRQAAKPSPEEVKKKVEAPVAVPDSGSLEKTAQAAEVKLEKALQELEPEKKDGPRSEVKVIEVAEEKAKDEKLETQTPPWRQPAREKPPAKPRVVPQPRQTPQPPTTETGPVTSLV
ncbi:ATP-binding protein [Candidatus Parcubacteria bacterium]|nr:ATP-binding protein [Candidatus Parcubacteria bacterium]